jgi:hypothetical protein
MAADTAIVAVQGETDPATVDDLRETLTNRSALVAEAQRRVLRHTSTLRPTPRPLLRRRHPGLAAQTVGLRLQRHGIARHLGRRPIKCRLLVGAGWSNNHDLVLADPAGGPLDPESVAKVFDPGSRGGCRHGRRNIVIKP